MTLVYQLLLVRILASSVYSFNTYNRPVYSRASSCLYGTNWDALIKEDEDDDLQFNGPPVARDMKYNMFNINRQRENFESMKAVGGKELLNDIYARDPETDIFWYTGKIARVSGEIQFFSLHTTSHEVDTFNVLIFTSSTYLRCSY